MIGFPFDSRVTYDSEGNPTYDRAITSAPYRKLLEKLFKTGVMPTDSTNMQVLVSSGLTVTIKAGFAMVNGLMKLEEADKTLTLSASDESYNRIDTIALRLDDTESVRTCEYVVIKGTPAGSPTAPALTRTSTIYDLGLANVLVKKNATELTASCITDTRYDSSRCGVISSISQFDTTTLYNQIQADLAEFKANEESDFESWSADEKATFQAWEEATEDDFDTWLASIKDKLDGDTAGHLQLEIDQKVDLPTTSGTTGQALVLDEDGNVVWGDAQSLVKSVKDNEFTVSEEGELELDTQIKNKLSNFDDTTNKLKDSALSSNVTNKLSTVDENVTNGFLQNKNIIYDIRIGVSFRLQSYKYYGICIAEVEPNKNYTVSLLGVTSGLKDTYICQVANLGDTTPTTATFKMTNTTETIQTHTNTKYLIVQIGNADESNMTNQIITNAKPQIEKGTVISPTYAEPNGMSNKQITEELSDNSIRYIDYDLYGTAITTLDNGYYYAEIHFESSLPSGCEIISAKWKTGSFSAGIFFVPTPAKVIVQSPKSLPSTWATSSNVRVMRVFYTKTKQ